jgi:hypothetical protein
MSNSNNLIICCSIVSKDYHWEQSSQYRNLSVLLIRNLGELILISQLKIEFFKMKKAIPTLHKALFAESNSENNLILL